MKIVGPIILLVCGVLALAGVFMPWFGGNLLSISRWEAYSAFGMFSIDFFLVFIGSMLLLVFALSAAIVSANPEGSQKMVGNLCILASLGAVMGMGGASLLLLDLVESDSVGLLGYGFYVSYAAAALGLIFGIIASIRARA